MPWDGSNNYQYPPGTEGVPDQTIESIKYNTFIADLRDNDLNRPRPITRGGTGAGDAVTALTNLGGEKAQQIVTNYDSMTWLSGSFYSAASATASPVAGHRFVGMVSVQDANNIVIQAYDLDSTPIGGAYSRIKKDGVFGSWVSLKAVADADYVNVTGDTMTNELTINAPINVGLKVKNESIEGIFVPSALNVIGIGAISNHGLHLLTNNASRVAVLNTGEVNIASTTDANSTTSGALTVAGGVGIIKNVFAGGKFSTAAKNNLFGNASGAGIAPLDASEANIKLYDIGGGNWCGIGADSAGGMWFRTGNSGTGSPAFHIAASNLQVSVRSTVASSSAGTGALIVSGGVGVGETLNVSNNVRVINGSLAINTTNTAHKLSVIGVSGSFATWLKAPNVSSQSFGLLLDAGTSLSDNALLVRNAAETPLFQITGVGTANLYSTQNSTGFSNGALVVAGGVGIAGAVNINNVLGITVPLNTGITITGGGFLGGIIFASALASNSICIGTTSNHAISFATANAYRGHIATNGDLIITAMGYKPGGGVWGDSSDIRIKNVEGNYSRGLNDIVKLNTVYFTFKGNDTIEPPNNQLMIKQEKENVSTPVVPYKNSPHYAVAKDGKRFVGLIAQEVELVFPEMVLKRNGYIDGNQIEDLYDLDTSPLIFAMINAVKELKTRVETLEGS